MNYISTIQQLLSERIEVLSSIFCDAEISQTVKKATDSIVSCIQSSGKVLIAGNGGSAAQSQHFCSELLGRFKKRRFPIQALSLSSDISLVTCIANDFGYERIFSRQIEGLGHTGDVFVAFTTSGKSRNIIEALTECKMRGIDTIVFTGNSTEELKRLVKCVITIPSEDTAIIQEIHMLLIHIICEIIEKRLVEDDFVWNKVIELGHQGYNCLLLDRDGVINNVKANGYINSYQEFSFRKDFLHHIKKISDSYKYIFVVSNQKGVGKGLVSMNELELVHKKMVSDIEQQNGRIDKIYVSTSVDNDAYDNKPNIGMTEMIKSDFPDMDFTKAVMVGDSATDFLFAENLKCQFVYARTR